MRRLHMYFLLWALLGLSALSCKRDPYTYAIIDTSMGQIKVLLYNSTPKHRDNFIKLVDEKFYDGLLFHRIIPRFMIQGGDPDSRNADPTQVLGMGDLPYNIEPEIGAPHIRGALAAAQKTNPQKLSSASQFYIVTGDKITGEELDVLERNKGIKYNEAQRQLYLELGGAPWLDKDYTVFGEVVKGIEVAENISAMPTTFRDRPAKDIVIKNIRIVKRR